MSTRIRLSPPTERAISLTLLISLPFDHAPLPVPASSSLSCAFFEKDSRQGKAWRRSRSREGLAGLGALVASAMCWGLGGVVGSAERAWRSSALGGPTPFVSVSPVFGNTFERACGLERSSWSGSATGKM